jgi:hypothetical protein
VATTADSAVHNAHEWFEVNSGWAPPDSDTLAEWLVRPWPGVVGPHPEST